MSGPSVPGNRRLSDDEVLRAVPPTTGAKEFRVGIFVILGIVGFFTVLFAMTSPATFRGRYMVVTRVEDAQGIRKGDPVRMRGINVGRVHQFALEGEGVMITLEVEGEWAIPEGSRVELISAGLLGGLAVSIIPGAGTQSLRPFDELPGQSVAGLFDSAGNLTSDLGDVLQRVQVLLSDTTMTDVASSVASLRTVMNDLSAITQGQAEQVQALTASLNRSATNVEGLTDSEELTSTLASADSTMSALNRTSTALERATTSLNTVLRRIEQGEGTLGKLSTNDSLYVSLNAAAESLRELLDDVRANPGRYIKLQIF